MTVGWSLGIVPFWGICAELCDWLVAGGTEDLGARGAKGKKRASFAAGVM